MASLKGVNEPKKKLPVSSAAVAAASAATASAITTIATASTAATMATAPTTATAAVSAMPAASATAACPATFSLRPGFIHHECAAKKILAVEGGNRFLRLGVVVNFGETESARLSRKTIPKQRE
jgi:hypothetical protein